MAHVMKRVTPFLSTPLLWLLAACTAPDQRQQNANAEHDLPDTSVLASKDFLSQTPSTPVMRPIRPLNEAVVLAVEIDLAAPAHPVLVGTTNLPNGTRIMTAVRGGPNDFFGQDETTVQDGAFRSGPFGPESGLLAGRYSASVSVPAPKTQSEAVRKVIGENGERLSGRLVRRGNFGPSVSTEVAFQIGRNADLTTARQRHEDNVRNAYRLLDEMQMHVNSGQKMDSLRRSEDLAVMRRCTTRMHQNQARIRALHARIDSLSTSTGIRINDEVGAVLLCNSCLDDAADDCGRAKRFLNEARALLQGKSP